MPNQKCVFCGDTDLIDLELSFELLDDSAKDFYLDCNPDLAPVCLDCWQSSFMVLPL